MLSGSFRSPTLSGRYGGWCETAAGFRGQGGHAIALQLSQAFDVMGLLERNPLYR